MAMTRMQFAFAVGLGAIAIILFAALIRPQHQNVLKADRADAVSPRVVRVIPLYREPPLAEPAKPPIAPLVKLAGDPPRAPDAPLTPAAPTPQAAPPALNEHELLEPGPPIQRHWHDSGGNICARHGMHKVETHHGKSWRCQYARR